MHEFRISWIKESVEIFGAIRREHIQRKFGISQPQASYDIRDALARWPGLMGYNKSTKQYEILAGDRCLTEAEKAAQAGRCGCHGVDDMCPCQNVANRVKDPGW